MATRVPSSSFPPDMQQSLTLWGSDGTLLYISFMHFVIISFTVVRCVLCSASGGCQGCRARLLWQLAHEEALAEVLQLLCHLSSTRYCSAPPQASSMPERPRAPPSSLALTWTA